MLLRKEHELVELLIEYDRAIIAEGVVSLDDLKIHRARLKELETAIAELRQHVESLLKTITH